MQHQIGIRTDNAGWNSHMSALPSLANLLAMARKEMPHVSASMMVFDVEDTQMSADETYLPLLSENFAGGLGAASLGELPTLAGDPSRTTPLRQASIEALQSTYTNDAPAAYPRQTMFTHALEQMNAKEELLPETVGLFDGYTLPPMQFLENLLTEMDSRRTKQGHALAEPPMYLPVGLFDLADDPPRQRATAQPAHSEPAPRTAALPAHREAAPLDQVELAAALPVSASNASTDAHEPHYARATFPFANFVPMVPTAASAAASPVKGNVRAAAAAARRLTSALADYYASDDQETGSKEGRMRKAPSLIGVKRRSAEMMCTQASAPAMLQGGEHSDMFPVHTSGEDTGAPSVNNSDGEPGEEVSKGGRKTHKRARKVTVCTNCGSSQTPQWRCGPLGPRTLCNACGVRYKKGVSLKCKPVA